MIFQQYRGHLLVVRQPDHGYALKAGQLTYDCRYSTMHGMLLKLVKPEWNGIGKKKGGE